MLSDQEQRTPVVCPSATSDQPSGFPRRGRALRVGPARNPRNFRHARESGEPGRFPGAWSVASLAARNGSLRSPGAPSCKLPLALASPEGLTLLRATCDGRGVARSNERRVGGGLRSGCSRARGPRGDQALRWMSGLRVGCLPRPSPRSSSTPAGWRSTTATRPRCLVGTNSALRVARCGRECESGGRSRTGPGGLRRSRGVGLLLRRPGRYVRAYAVCAPERAFGCCAAAQPQRLSRASIAIDRGAPNAKRMPGTRYRDVRGLSRLHS